MRRAATSVPANIAEAFPKRSPTDKLRVLNISKCSLEELRYFFILARDLQYLPPDEGWPDLEDVSRILLAYTRSVASSRQPDSLTT
jgi:four helix bundle protein